jgi:hypothetical protein
MTYSLITLWHERNRFLPGILAVAFSALLIVVQCGLLLGIFSMFAMPIDRSAADLWVPYPGTRSVDLCPPIPLAWQARLARQPEVERIEPYDGLRRLVGIDRRGRGHQPNVICGHGCIAARVRRARGPRHPHMAHLHSGVNSIFLGGTVRHRPGVACVHRRGPNHGGLGGQDPSSNLALGLRGSADDGHGVVVRIVLSAVFTPGPTGCSLTLKDRAHHGHQANS